IENQNTVKDKMLNESASPEIKATGDNLQEGQRKTLLLAAQLTQLLFKKLKDNPTLRKDLKIKLDEPANVKIYVGDELKYQSQEGANPEVNQLKKEQLELIQKALQMKVGDELNSQANITITVNDKPVLTVKNGVLQKNDLQAELMGELSQEISLEKRGKKTSDFTIENSNQSKQIEEKTKSSQEWENKDNNQEPKQIPIEIPDESQEKETINRKPKEITIEIPDESKGKTKKEFLEIPIEIPNESQEIEHKLDTQTLKKQGIDYNLVREDLEQVPNKNSPVIIIVNNNQQRNKLAEATQKAPSNTKVGLLQRVKDFLKQKTPQPISRAVNILMSPFRNEQARQQDLKGLSTLMTSKKLLQEFGAKNHETMNFTTGNYQFQQEKDASIKVTDAQRGILFNYDGKIGSITTNNLEKGDIKALDQIKQELNQYQKNRSRRQQERNQEKEVVAIG
ncbi:MAG: hypothetical protein AB4041_07135, partial [Microcystaceae cyanobacterium]